MYGRSRYRGPRSEPTKRGETFEPVHPDLRPLLFIYRPDKKLYNHRPQEGHTSERVGDKIGPIETRKTGPDLPSLTNVLTLSTLKQKFPVYRVPTLTSVQDFTVLSSVLAGTPYVLPSPSPLGSRMFLRSSTLGPGTRNRYDVHLPRHSTGTLPYTGVPESDWFSPILPSSVGPCNIPDPVIYRGCTGYTCPLVVADRSVNPDTFQGLERHGLVLVHSLRSSVKFLLFPYKIKNRGIHTPVSRYERSILKVDTKGLLNSFRTPT